MALMKRERLLREEVAQLKMQLDAALKACEGGNK
jgi:hypothetical protein